MTAMTLFLFFIFPTQFNMTITQVQDGRNKCVSVRKKLSYEMIKNGKKKKIENKS